MGLISLRVLSELRVKSLAFSGKGGWAKDFPDIENTVSAGSCNELVDSVGSKE